MHHGFYSAYHNTTLRPGVLSAVKTAKELYGDIPIMVTGHSMGGAMAAFCGLDLTVCFKDLLLLYTITSRCPYILTCFSNLIALVIEYPCNHYCFCTPLGIMT